MNTFKETTLSNKQYGELLAKLKDIPTLPVVAMQINQLINDPNTSSADIAEVLKKDQVLTAKILRLVNSSYYAIPGGVADVQRALAFLGFNTLAQLVLSLSVFSLFSEINSEDFSMNEFWRHAIATAVASEGIAKQVTLPRPLAPLKPEVAFTCGLLHDIGKLVLHEIDPKRLLLIVRDAKARSTSFVEVEREHDLPGHSFLGEVIAEKWGLPQIIRLCIRYHHQDVTTMQTLLESDKPMVQVVRLANQIAVKNRIGQSGDCSPAEVSEDFLKPLGLKASDLPGIEERLARDMERAGAFLSAYR